jgi:hypothetical protein
MVVALHLEHGGQPVADIDHAGVLAGTVDHPGRRGRQLPEPDAGRFVRAVLGPHDAEHAEFCQCRRAPHDGQHLGVFVGAEAELAGEGLVNGLGHGALINRLCGGIRVFSNRKKGFSPQRRGDGEKKNKALSWYSSPRLPVSVVHLTFLSFAASQISSGDGYTNGQNG